MAASDAWGSVQLAPPNAIFHLTKRFNEDTAAAKLNLGVGAYRTEEGKPLVLRAVAEAERRIAADQLLDHEYLPISGLLAFRQAVSPLVFGAASAAVAEKRIACVQTLSGTGALRLGAEFLAQQPVPGGGELVVLVPNPTWENHGKVFGMAGFRAVREYRYWHARDKRLDLAGMLEDVRAAPRGAVILLHACAHNPTGCDPSLEEWGAIADAVAAAGLIPFFDMAYQGFASGDTDVDAGAIRLFVDRGFSPLVATSFAKNMGLYGERVGSLQVVAPTAAAAAAVNSQLELLVRASYSNPPAHGARVVALVLTDPALRQLWLEELRAMVARIRRLRAELREQLEARGAPGTWEHVTGQIGMFSYTGLTREQSIKMVESHHIYMVDTGRISLPGLSTPMVPFLVDAMLRVMKGEGK
jgi:aspartate aminotransferase